MPLLKIQTNQPIGKEQQTALLSHLTALIADKLEKPAQYIQVVLQSEVAMMLGNDTGPTAFAELRSLGLPEDKAPLLSDALCSAFETHLGVPPDRTFINFFDFPRARWGWNGKTFA